MGGARLRALERLARMKLDADLALLTQAARARAETLAALERLTVRPAEGGDLSPVAAGIAALTYQRWADQRRTEINTRLAKQTAEWMEVRDRAALAFGRVEALGGLAKRMEEAQKRQK